jgi:hypothetical protein
MIDESASHMGENTGWFFLKEESLPGREIARLINT